MQCRIRDFRCKEVINVCDGCRLGYVSDLDVRVPEGQVVAIIVYGPGRFFGRFGRGEEFGASVADKCPRGFHRGGICVCRRSGHGSSG